MARNPRRMALYEVIKSSRSKVPTSQQGLIRDKTEGSDGTERSSHGRGAVRGLERRLVISVSYRVAAVWLLVFLLILMMSYRWGQNAGIRKASAGLTSAGSELTNLNGQDAGEIRETVKSGTEDSQETDREKTLVEDKNLDHVIVIATYRTRRDLVPVMEYFQSQGIETSIEERSGYYFLETKQKFASPKEKGSKLSKELIRVKEIGKKYDAPSGYESFKPNLFQDAYGMKL